MWPVRRLAYKRDVSCAVAAQGIGCAGSYKKSGRSLIASRNHFSWTRSTGFWTVRFLFIAQLAAALSCYSPLQAYLELAWTGQSTRAR